MKRAESESFKHVLITGASSGIGAALARAYAREGMRLSLTARHAMRLGEVATQCRNAGADVSIQTLDVTDSEALAAWIVACDSQQPVDMVIANAGMGGELVMAASAGETLPLAHDIVTTNILGVAGTVIPLLPRFLARKRGHVVVMSSLAAFIGLPQAPLYSASKAAVRVYAHGLRRLLAPNAIRVTVICPGFVDTPMSRSVPGDRPFLWNSERAARCIVDGLARGRSEIIFPWQLAALTRLAAALPAPLLNRILARRSRG